MYILWRNHFKIIHILTEIINEDIKRFETLLYPIHRRERYREEGVSNIAKQREGKHESASLK